MTNPNEDQDWLDALAGKPNPNADPDVTRRATLLRQAIQRHDAALGVNDFDVEAGLQKLKFRMRQEGLSGPISPVEYISKFFARSSRTAPIDPTNIPNFLLRNTASPHRIDLPYSARSSNMPRFQRNSEFNATGEPAQYISNLKKEYSSFFCSPKLPKTISEMEYVGLDQDMANNLLGFLGRGHDEEMTVTSFHYALSRTKVGACFGRSFNRAILKQWERVVKSDSIDTEMEMALVLVTTDSWNWQCHPSQPI